jgi:hypothetical protein
VPFGQNENKQKLFSEALKSAYKKWLKEWENSEILRRGSSAI